MIVTIKTFACIMKQLFHWLSLILIFFNSVTIAYNFKKNRSYNKSPVLFPFSI